MFATLHFTLKTLHALHLTPWHSTLFTAQSTLYTALYTLHSTLHSTLRTPQSPLHTLHTTFPTQHFTVFTLQTLHCTSFHTPRSTLVWQQGKNVQDCWNNLLHKKCFTSLPSVRWSLLFFQRVVKWGERWVCPVSKIAQFRFWRETREHWGPIHPIYLIICTSHSRVPYTWIDPLHKKRFPWCGYFFLMWGKGPILALPLVAIGPSPPTASCLANPHDSQPSCSFTYLELS